MNQIRNLTSQKCGILSSFSLIPGIKTIQEVIRPNRRNNEYTILVEVEFLQVGQALQHSPQAALPQQHATFAAQVAAEHTPKTAPILRNTPTWTPKVYGEENRPTTSPKPYTIIEDRKI